MILFTILSTLEQTAYQRHRTEDSHYLYRSRNSGNHHHMRGRCEFLCDDRAMALSVAEDSKLASHLLLSNHYCCYPRS